MTENQGQRGNNFSKADQNCSRRNTNYNHQLGRNGYGQAYNMHQSANLMAQGIQGMTVTDQPFPNQTKALMMAGAPQYANISLHSAIPSALWGANGQFIYAGNHSYPTSTHQQSPALYSPVTAPYLTHGYAQHHDNSPNSQTWTPSHTTGDVPTLITPRRDSISSNENDVPGTPSYSGYSYQGAVPISRSHSGMYTQSTPSPSQMASPYGLPMNKMPEKRSISPSLHMVLVKDPAIPQAIPAPSSPLKPLDRALENLRGETNVYIRGLHPETTDEMLESWGRRFGDIKSSKSIIDHSTGLCKGFGFVKYHSYEDAENCIRGFHYLGYEVSFARESFYSKLKTFADDGNTNLYVSNLPKTLNEHELATIFNPHKVCSARILRDKNGMGRGVGFARVCEEVIKQFNNNPISTHGEEHTIQIRYADSQEQKHLKQQTAAARQFRSAEYEYATQFHKQGACVGRSSLSPYSALGHENIAPGNEFEAYLGASSGAPFRGNRWAQSALRGRGLLAAIPYGGNAQHPDTDAASQHSTVDKGPIRRDTVADTKTATASPPAIAHGDNSPNDCAQSAKSA
ncbi:hypothetical protein MBLNU459_g7352t2 [Dothideomycetes sp. NU459]